MVGETVAATTTLSAFDRAIGTARITLRAVLFVVVLTWVASVPTMLRVAVFPEQFMALVIGLGTAIVLIDDYPWPRHLRRVLRLFDIAAAILALAIGVWVAAIFPTLPFALWNKPIAVVVATAELRRWFLHGAGQRGELSGGLRRQLR